MSSQDDPLSGLTAEQWAAIAALSDEFLASYISILGDSATASYMAGQLYGLQKVHLEEITPLGFEPKEAITPEVHPAYKALPKEQQKVDVQKAQMHDILQTSKDYGYDYAKRLKDTGGTTTAKGQHTPWLRSFDNEQRARIGQIIQDGMAQGLPTGVRESGTGRYPKGSIADSLQDYFNERKSHASTVARTEVAGIQNDGLGFRLGRHGVSKVRIRDGHSHGSDEECNIRDGEIWTLPYAIWFKLCHPNGSFGYDPYYGDEQPIIHSDGPDAGSTLLGE